MLSKLLSCIGFLYKLVLCSFSRIDPTQDRIAGKATLMPTVQRKLVSNFIRCSFGSNWMRQHQWFEDHKTPPGYLPTPPRAHHSAWRAMRSSSGTRTGSTTTPPRAASAGERSLCPCLTRPHQTVKAVSDRKLLPTAITTLGEWRLVFQRQLIPELCSGETAPLKQAEEQSASQKLHCLWSSSSKFFSCRVAFQRATMTARPSVTVVCDELRHPSRLANSVAHGLPCKQCRPSWLPFVVLQWQLSDSVKAAEPVDVTDCQPTELCSKKGRQRPSQWECAPHWASVGLLDCSSTIPAWWETMPSARVVSCLTNWYPIAVDMTVTGSFTSTTRSVTFTLSFRANCP